MVEIKIDDIKTEMDDNSITITRISTRKYSLQEFVQNFEGMLLDIREGEDELKNARRHIASREEGIADIRTKVTKLREHYRAAKERNRDSSSS